jgi:arylsulfatase A-like enzyme
MSEGALVKRGVAAVGLIALALALAAPAGCSRKATEPKAGSPPNIILIVLDTLRRDHLGCYGYERDTSPSVDRFAEAATLYTDCVSTAAWTLPAHASLFTGKYPFEHGAYTLVTADRKMKDAHPLSDEQFTLAEFLQAEGFQTGAFVANAAYCGAWTRLDQGFDDYYVEFTFAEKLMPRIFKWLERRGDTPFLLFLNFMDTHTPYNVSPRPGFIDPPATRQTPALSRRFAQAVLPGKRAVPRGLRQRVIDQYDTAIANVDEQVGRLIEKLKALGVFDKALIVITSDHGQYFGEHLLADHSKDIYQAALSVPLIVKAPGQTQREVVDRRISLAMLPNLICAQLSPELAARAHQHFPEAVGAETVIAENYFSRSKDIFGKPWSDRFRRIRTAVFSGPYKYIRSSDGQHELYNLQHDPQETTNLVKRQRELAVRMRDLLETFQSGRQPARTAQPDGTPLSDEELRLLATLGYVDAPDGDEDEANSPEDPLTGDDDSP